MVATDLKHGDDVFVARPFVEERVVAACIVHFARSVLRPHLVLLPDSKDEHQCFERLASDCPVTILPEGSIGLRGWEMSAIYRSVVLCAICAFWGERRV